MQNVVILFILSSLIGLSVYSYDIYTKNTKLPSLMKLVWFLTIAYSGLLGLFVYWYSGRIQISNDSIYRRACRSTAHCYSGCGLGEIIGVTLATVFFGGIAISIAIGSFTFAYILGFALTIGPLMQDGLPFKEAFSDALISDTLTITVMETAAISMDLYILSNVQPSLVDPLFWVALFVSLSFGFLVAYPFNYLLIHFGVKEGMMDPRMLNEDVNTQ